MRYSPSQAEYHAIEQMTDTQRLEYFLTRVFETEEVWGLDDGVEWLITTTENGMTMPLWPYHALTHNFAQSQLNTDLQPEAQSLEQFLNSTLAMLIEDEVMVEVMPAAAKPGSVVAPQHLLSIFEGMIDAGEYTLDG